SVAGRIAAARSRRDVPEVGPAGWHGPTGRALRLQERTLPTRDFLRPCATLLLLLWIVVGATSVATLWCSVWFGARAAFKSKSVATEVAPTNGQGPRGVAAEAAPAVGQAEVSPYGRAV